MSALDCDHGADCYLDCGDCGRCECCEAMTGDWVECPSGDRLRVNTTSEQEAASLALALELTGQPGRWYAWPVVRLSASGTWQATGDTLVVRPWPAQ